MPKTIAITPSWYWPAGIARAAGIPPFRLDELSVSRWARERPDSLAVAGAEERLTWRDLAARVDEARGHAAAGEITMNACATPASVVEILAALATGGTVRLWASAAPPGDDPHSLSESMVAIGAPGHAVWHSNHSLVAAAVSTATFLAVTPARPWVVSLPLDRWESLHAIAVALLVGAPLVLPHPGGALEGIAREGAGWLACDLEDAHALTRESKRDVKSVRGVLEATVLFTPGTFDPDHRRRVGKLFECPALTFYGLPQTGPIFASHPSWYLDESVGIPITNAHVVAVEPRSGMPLRTLWELVDEAEVTVWSPGLAVHDDDDPGRSRHRDGRFTTGMRASADANGMVYLLG